MAALHPPQLTGQLCFFRKYFFPLHLEIPEHSVNSQCPSLLAREQLCSMCARWSGDMQRLRVFPPSAPGITWQALPLLMSGRYQLLEKAARSCHGGSLKGEAEEEAVWDVIVGSCVAE